MKSATTSALAGIACWRRDQVRRLSDHSFELTVLNGDILDSGFAELFRHSTRRFQLGAEVARDGLSAQVVELSERGQPTRIQFTTAQHRSEAIARTEGPYPPALHRNRPGSFTRCGVPAPVPSSRAVFLLSR